MNDQMGTRTRQLILSLPFLAALVLLWLLYGDTFGIWWFLWREPGSFYAHAMFVPVFAGVMIWRNREQLAAARWNPSWAGLGLLVLAMGLLLIGRNSEVRAIPSFSFVVVLLGGALLLIGPAKTRVLLFPLLFILTMIPMLPDQIINVIAFPIQLLSTRMAEGFLNLLGLHAVREGTMLQMEHYRMAVEGACSGFRTLLSLLTFSAAFAYLVEGQLWKRWLLFGVTIPLSLLINGLRITFIGIVGELVSTHAAATFHDYSGFIVLILAFLFLFNFAKLIGCQSFLGVPLQDDDLDSASDATPAENAPTGSEPAWWQTLLAWRPTTRQLQRVLPYILALDGTLLLTWGLEGKVFTATIQQPPIATTQVPMQVTADGVTYTAQPGPLLDKLPKDIQEQLNPMRLINRDYEGSDGARMTLFMTAGNARWTFHDPHYCSLGNDAVLHDVGIITVPTSRGPLQLLECQFQRNGSPERSIMMYCYVVGDQVFQTTDQMHRSILWQTIFGSSGRPSYFLRFTQDVPGTDEEKRQQLIRFIKGVYENIAPVLKGEQPAIAEPPPVPVDTER